MFGVNFAIRGRKVFSEIFFLCFLKNTILLYYYYELQTNCLGCKILILFLFQIMLTKSERKTSMNKVGSLDVVS